jgi:DNA uptake protein ComE-like DNA-binding protein
VFERWQQLKARWHPLAKRLETDPAYRLETYQDVRVAAAFGFAIDVNRATVDDWLRLPGISIRQAQILYQLQRAGVQFYCLEDIAAALGISVSHLQPLGGVLSFCHYDEAGLIAPQPLNLNQASLEQLQRIPGITTQLAGLILRDRTRFGPFNSIADFQRRLGIPADILQNLMYYLSV